MSDENEYEEGGWEIEEGPSVGVSIEINGLSLYTHHGAFEAEREIGQRLIVDLRFDIGEPDALVTDKLEDTVDYGVVCQQVAFVCQRQSVKTLERLSAMIADHLVEHFGVKDVTVKLAKPQPPIPFPVESVAVEIWREEPDGDDEEDSDDEEVD